MKRKNILIATLLIASSALAGAVPAGDNERTVTIPLTQQSQETATRNIRLTVVSPGIIRVQATPNDQFKNRESLVIINHEIGQASHTATETASQVVLTTSALKVTVDKQTGRIAFYDVKTGKVLLQESARNGKRFTKYVCAQTGVSLAQRTGYSWLTQFDSPSDEAFYGLGQHQAEEMNYKGKNEELFQYNTKVSVPFVVSTNHYGLLWDSYSYGRWGNPNAYQQLQRIFTLYDKNGRQGALTGTYTDQTGKVIVRQEDSIYYENLVTVKNLPEMRLDGARVVYEGSIESPEDNAYNFILYYAGYMKMYLDGKLVVPERWRTAWNPNSYKFSIPMKKGVKVPLRIEWQPDGGLSYCGLRAAVPQTAAQQNKLSIWSEMDPEMDYYFIHGNTMDDIISGYRKLTGKSPIMPKWAMGYWQSRDKYSSSNDLLSTFSEFRKRNIPIDNIVQDWSYWKEDSWGDQEFDRSRYPDPKAMMDSIHDMHGRLMISVWPKYYPTTANFKELNDKGYMYQQALKDSVRDWISPGYLGTFYDPYAKEARDIFWKQINRGIYSKGVDAWWMDASEPDIVSNTDIDYRKQLCGPTAVGSSTEYFNTYALMNAKGIYEGQRSVNPNTRVFLLTRSGFAGLQRYSTATWSGDIGSRWEDMRAQMTAGMNYALSGIPYWTMDIGGYCTENRYDAGQKVFDKTGVENEDLKEWRELNTRWHQFATFVPLYRSHGKFPLREPWNIAPAEHPAYQSILYYDRLRYSLMPYIYTLAGMTYFKDYTIMRALVMDFTSDRQVTDIKDQWMFGPSIMACPVGYYKARNREVYFPQQSDWYDFYTGNYIKGGQQLKVDAPYECIPLFVRAGSIIPVGPQMEWSDEKKPELINLYVYEGADAVFELYEDEGTNYNYEKGKYSTIEIKYSEADKKLTIGARKGTFDGMLMNRRFNVVVVSPTKKMSLDVNQPKGKMVKYQGKSIVVKL